MNPAPIIYLRDASPSWLSPPEPRSEYVRPSMRVPSLREQPELAQQLRDLLPRSS